METVNIHAAKTNLSKLIERVEMGAEITICRNGKPLVNLTPYKKIATRQPRQGGQWTDKINYAADYHQADAMIEKLFNASEIFPKDKK